MRCIAAIGLNLRLCTGISDYCLLVAISSIVSRFGGRALAARFKGGVAGVAAGHIDIWVTEVEMESTARVVKAAAVWAAD